MTKKQSKYQEYKRHSEALLRIMGTLNSAVITDTIERVPFLAPGKRLFFERIDANSCKVSIVDAFQAAVVRHNNWTT